MGQYPFFPSKYVSGIQQVSKMLDLEDKVKSADLIITGEGQVDSQTYKGKAISYLIELAQKHNKPIAIIAGKIKNAEKLNSKQIQFIDISELAGSVKESISNPAHWISKGVEKIKKTIPNF